MITRAEIKAAADAMMRAMFAPHELPLDAELHAKYTATAKAALEAAAAARWQSNDIVDRLRWCRWKDRKTGDYTNAYDTASVEAERLEAADEIERLRAQLPDPPAEG